MLKSVTLRKIVKKNKYCVVYIYGKTMIMKKPILAIVGMGFILLAVWMSGCLNANDRSTASVVDISRNPDKYINTTVTIKGFYAGSEQAFWGPLYRIRDSSGNSILSELSEQLNNSTLVLDTEYYWTGKIVQDKEVIKLMVSDIQPV